MKPQRSSFGADLKRQERSHLEAYVEQVRAVESRFPAFADSIIDYGFITLDLNLKIVGWNHGAEVLLGYSESEVLGMSGTILFTPEDNLKGVPELEISTALREGRAEDERFHMRKDGSRFWGSGIVTALSSTSGEIEGYVKVMRDRTEQRLLHEALRHREAHLRVLIDNLRDCAVFDLDLDGAICGWNPGAEQLFGYTEAETVGVDGGEFFAVAGYSAEAFATGLAAALERDRVEGESWLSRKDGVRFYARWIVNAMRDQDEKLVGFAIVLRDETDRQRATDADDLRRRHASHLLERQAQLASTALDRTQVELRDVARRLLNVQEEERRRLARDLHDHLAQRLALLDMGLARLREGPFGGLELLGTGIQALQEQAAALSEDVRNISHRMHPSIIEHLGLAAAIKSLCREYGSSRTAPVRFEGALCNGGIPLDEATAFYRICEEALRNVQKHAGDVPVWVELKGSEEEMKLCVKDSGPGFRLDQVDCGKHLGLISMQERASMIGATCRFVSEPGKGTTVDISLWRGLETKFYSQSA